MGLFTLRDAKPGDLEYINMICQEQDLGQIDRVEQVSVAVNADDEAVGFIRIKEVLDSAGTRHAYVYPLAVFLVWQGYGVGSALIERSLIEFGSLRLVACEASRGFYPKIGFEAIEMSEVAAKISHDCELCVRNGSCQPQAFALSYEKSRLATFLLCLQDIQAYWQSCLKRCVHCNSCASRCELFFDESYQSNLENIPTLLEFGLELLETSIERAKKLGSIAAIDSVQDFAVTHAGVYAATRRCCMCGRCTARCLAGLDAAHIMQKWRELYRMCSLMAHPTDDLKSVEVDKRWHLFSVYRHLYDIEYSEFLQLEEANYKDAETLLFPGCTLATYGDKVLRKLGHWLDDQGEKWAMSIDCCGSPLVSRGHFKRAEALRSKIIDKCKEVGIKRIITICAGCESELAQSLGLTKQDCDQIEIIPLTRLMQERGVQFKCEDVCVFDSCHDRQQKHGAPLRKLVAANASLALAHEGCDTFCCGAGGAVSTFDSEIGISRISRLVRDIDRSQAKLALCTCPTCAYSFAYQRLYGQLGSSQDRVIAKHYLEVLFETDIEWDEVFRRAEQMYTGPNSDWVVSQLY